MFRYNKYLHISYDVQGYIYFRCRNFKRLPDGEKDVIRKIARDVGGQYHKAVLEAMTTRASVEAISQKHFMDRSLLYRLIREFYKAFAATL